MAQALPATARTGRDNQREYESGRGGLPTPLGCCDARLATKLETLRC